MNSENKFLSTVLIVLIVLLVLVGCEEIPTQPTKVSKIKKFSSGAELIKAFEEARETGRGYGILLEKGVFATAVAESAQAEAPQAADSGRDFSETNIQVEGVDEADIIKTDGDYIYTLAQGNLVIAKAYPADEAEIVSTIKFDNFYFYPNELFIHKDRLLVFGSSNYIFETPQNQGEIAQEEPTNAKMVASISPDYYPYYGSFMTAKLYDTSDKGNPELLRTVDFEGNYLTSRKINEDVYFVVNSYPRFYGGPKPLCEDIVPMYRESTNDKKPELEDMKPIARCVDIGYIEPIQAQNFITVASISMTDEDADVNKEVIVGSGQNVYASLENMYIAQTSWPIYNTLGELAKDFVENTIITKFGLDNGEIEFLGTGEVKGHILNQFSMDEYDEHFRIATTAGEIWGGK